jgi:hypothetical protein
MLTRLPRRWSLALVAGCVAGAIASVAPVAAQTGPVIVPPVAPIVVGLPAGIPLGGAVLPGHKGGTTRDGLIWSKSGRADVDIAVDRHHGQAAAR